MKKIYFITGSQDLYGDETLKQVAIDSKEVVQFLDEKISTVDIVWQPTVRNSEEAEDCLIKASADKDCIAVITWMHTFSPAKMWIKGLQRLTKPLLHLHTQYNRELPYSSIDMDFMNLNQSAHGDREFGFICTRLGIKRKVVAGYYKNEKVIKRISNFVDVALAMDFSHNLKVATFGFNMRDVAVTDGDRVESEIRYGWNVNYYGIGDLVTLVNKVTDAEVKEKLDEYNAKYQMNTDNLDAVKEQAKYEIALEKFLSEKKIGAFTDTFEDLHGLNQLPGLAVQNLMSKNYGFGPEGDYKTSALMAVLCKMSENREGATAFLEDYTYDLTEGEELELASHMLEVSPVFAKNQPKIEVHPLGIGGKSAPARLVFDGIEGKGIAVSMVDMGTHFRLICADVELVKQPKEMPKLPVARVMWKILPEFSNGAERWIYAGGAHHAVVSTALTKEDIELFAHLTNTELVIID
ncbi:MAG: L-arabinose isomerase [Clostridiales bacterium]|nr:L-arabinose isomerase [Clostridiales bacterium]